MRKIYWLVLAFALCFQSLCRAQETNIASVSLSTNASKGNLLFDGNPKTGWSLSVNDLSQEQWLMFTLQASGNVEGLTLQGTGFSADQLKQALEIYITYDPMNLGNPITYQVKEKNKEFALSFAPAYGAHLRLVLKTGVLKKDISINEIGVAIEAAKAAGNSGELKDMPHMNPNLPVEERVNLLLAEMTTAEKMELLREGWGIPGVPRLGIPDMKKVEAIHGFSYGQGATVYPQSIALGATWDRQLMEEVAGAIGDETVSAHAIQAWSPVLDIAQDPRWGRCEETYGEDPVLVTEMGGAWIKGYQSRGLLTTPKHFGGHGSTLGGRDSHDVGVSEREMREIHLVPFRDVIRKYDCQSIMMSYSDYMGVPVAKSSELLKGILRDEWGFDGFVVSDCGAINNLTDNKHYTALNKIEAAKQAMSVWIATNCGNVYNDKVVIDAAINGELNQEDLDNTCRTILRTMLRNGLFENNPSKSLDWNMLYPGWNSPEHRELARHAAREAIVLLENKDNILPLSKSLKSIAVIGPGADDLQPGDYTGKTLEGQLQSVLTGIKTAVSPQTKVIYEKGCDFFHTENTQIEKAVAAAKQADVAVLVLGDCSKSESDKESKKTSGENNDYASLILPGDQQRLLEAVCATGKPVILILQSGRPFNLSYAAEHCRGILVNWLPGQEGGHAAADVVFGDYNPAGRLPMTFPADVAQVPLNYNFKTSGRRYEYVDMEFYPLYSFGYGLSYTSFEYSNLKIQELANGNVTVSADVKNTGTRAGDEVVQLYITDMYASVKTRVMELKDFNRINLKPNETKTVSFELTPYQLSLLDDHMDRAVEAGEFKIMVGGTSPSFVANNKIKHSVGYKDNKAGVNGKLDYKKSLKADFAVNIVGIEDNLIDNTKTAVVSVKNNGNITDTGLLTMYVDGTKAGEIRHYELDPNQEKQIRFKVDKSDYKDLTFTTKYKIVKSSGQ